jgi:molybdopterin synthase catalytic subunit
MIRVAIGTNVLDVASEMAAHDRGGHGASASFVGRVRGDGGLAELFLEHAPAMTRTALEDLAATACARWPLNQLTLLHRVGSMAPGDVIVLVLASSAHRQAALEATAFLIDRLKTDVPLWKRESFDDGRSHWVEARESDAARAALWTDRA